MLRYSRVFLWVAVFFFALAACMYGATLSASYDKCQAEHASDPAYYKKGNANDVTYIPAINRIGILIDCEAVFANENGAAITGLATVLLTVVTFLLVWIARNQYITTRRQLRAWVLVTGGWLKNFGQGLVPHIEVRVVNTGQTPAFDVQVVNATILGAIPFTDVFPIIEIGPAAPRATLGPGVDLRPVAKDPTKLSREECDAIAQGTMGLYIFGKIRDRDIFDETHVTQLRLVFSKTNVKSADGVLSIAADGNKSD